MPQPEAPLGLSDWQTLARKSPDEAACQLLERVQQRLALPQQKAAFAWLPGREALAAQFAQAATKSGPLAGVPYALKDLFFAQGTPLRAGSSFPSAHFGPSERDGALANALSNQGAVLVGKTHLHEFAYGLTGENPHHGDCELPGFPGRTSGGSSSGSAAAVAAGIVPFSIGTDTGGSIRVPAAFCGLFGYRHQPLNTWIDDAFPLAPSFDTAGWFTANAVDMTTVSEALLGRSATQASPPRGYWLEPASWKDQAESEIVQGFLKTAERLATTADNDLARRFHTVFESSVTHYAVLQSAEAYQVHANHLDSQKDLYGKEVWGRIDRGRRWSSEQVAAAHAAWAEAKTFWKDYFETHDFLVLPATPFPALTKADCTLENRNRLLALTTPASLGGNPVVTIPYPLGNGLHGGAQIVLKSPQSPALRWALEHGMHRGV